MGIIGTRERQGVVHMNFIQRFIKNDHSSLAIYNEKRTNESVFSKSINVLQKYQKGNHLFVFTTIRIKGEVPPLSSASFLSSLLQPGAAPECSVIANTGR